MLGSPTNDADQITTCTYDGNDDVLTMTAVMQLKNSDQSDIQNQVEDLYNGYGQLVQQYQATSGAVNPSTAASVQYGYAQVGNASRLSSMTYPNGRILDYGYNAGIDATISRVSYQKDDGGSSAGVHLADYAYLGLNTIVVESEPQINAELTYIQVPGDTQSISDGGDRYTGLDRFGRVIDQAYYSTPNVPNQQLYCKWEGAMNP